MFSVYLSPLTNFFLHIWKQPGYRKEALIANCGKQKIEKNLRTKKEWTLRMNIFLFPGWWLPSSKSGQSYNIIHTGDVCYWRLLNKRGPIDLYRYSISYSAVYFHWKCACEEESRRLYTFLDIVRKIKCEEFVITI